MKTIAIISNVTSGLINFRFELIQQLAQTFHVVIISQENFDRKPLEELGCSFVQIDCNRHGTNPVKEINLFYRYVKILESVKPIVVLTYTIKPNIYAGAACAKLHIPYIANITGLGDAIENKGILSFITRKMYRFGLRKARKVFFQNESNCSLFLNEHIYNGDYDILPGSGVNLTMNCYEEYPHISTGDKPTILVIGRITKDKGIEEILEAAYQIHDIVKVVLIGRCEGKYEERIKKAEEEQVLQYVGEQRNIHEWIKESHAVLHASYHEGMSNVLLEAAACGRPVIATNIPGCKEAFDDGITGIGFNPKDVNSLIRAIKQFLSLSYEDRIQMGKNGRRKMEQVFDRRIVIDKYIGTINKIVGENKDETL